MSRQRPARQPEPAANGRPALAAKMEAVALLLAGGATVEAAARKAGVGSRTIRTWQAGCPEFTARVRELRSALTDRVLGLLSVASADAVLTLSELLKAKAEGTRQRAADALLTHATKHREADLTALLDELAGRVRAFETRRRKR